MVYLGGPRSRKGSRSRGIYLHDPPPGYSPPRPHIPFKVRQRKARQEYVLLRFTTVLLILLVVGFVVMMLLAAMHI
jgi:hypothetical protein